MKFLFTGLVVSSVLFANCVNNVIRTVPNTPYEIQMAALNATDLLASDGKVLKLYGRSPLDVYGTGPGLTELTQNGDKFLILTFNDNFEFSGLKRNPYMQIVDVSRNPLPEEKLTGGTFDHVLFPMLAYKELSYEETQSWILRAIDLLAPQGVLRFSVGLSEQQVQSLDIPSADSALQATAAVKQFLGQHYTGGEFSVMASYREFERNENDPHTRVVHETRLKERYGFVTFDIRKPAVVDTNPLARNSDAVKYANARVRNLPLVRDGKQIFGTPKAAPVQKPAPSNFSIFNPWSWF